MNANVEILPADNHAIMPIEMKELMLEAVSHGATVDVMKQLFELYKSARDFHAEKAFHGAMAKAKAEIPVIAKTNSAFGRYLYEDIGDIADIVVPILSKYDLYYRWETAPTEKPGVTIVTCVIAHKDGHSIRNSLPAVAEPGGKMNSNQATGSAQTYVQRYTLKAALGLAAAKDDDAQTSQGGDAKSQAAAEPHSSESPGAYLDRWGITLQNAVSAPTLRELWANESELRLQIFSKGDIRVASLKDRVAARIKELEPKIAPSESDGPQ